MKNRYIALSLLLAACAAGALFGYLFSGEDSLPWAAAADPASEVAKSSVAAKAKYLIAGYDGKLAVYIIGKDEPEIVFDLKLYMLPDVDRQRLESGIEVSDYQELLRLIEDFTS